MKKKHPVFLHTFEEVIYEEVSYGELEVDGAPRPSKLPRVQSVRRGCDISPYFIIIQGVFYH